MKEVILLVGPPGSGKSTYCSTNYKDYYCISQDDMGKKHLDYYKIGLETGLNIIIDRMNFNKEQRNRYLNLAKQQGYSTKIVVLHVPSEICLSRCKARLNHPTIKDNTDAVRAIDLFFRKYERVENKEADKVERLGWDGNKEQAIVSDLDGTLCNIDHRMNLLKGTSDSVSNQKKNWKGFFENIPNDTPNKWCQEILWKFQDSVPIILCSGRPDDHRKITEKWLNDNMIDYNHLFMRRRGDFRKDDLVKEIIYEFEIKPRYDILFWVDDRKQVVEKIRSHGVTVLACHEGNY